MAEERWITSYCLNKEGFPKILYASMVRLGILDHPEYVGREYNEYGTERCEVIIHIGESKDFPNIRPWSVSTTGFRFEDTYQLVARKALRYLCQIYEKHICHTPMRFFPPFVRTSPVWIARVKNLEGKDLCEYDPTVVLMSKYLLTLDEQYDNQTIKLTEYIRRAEEADKEIRKLCVQLAEAKAQAAKAESHKIQVIEALKQAEDHHTQQLKDAYLVTRAKRRSLSLEDKELPGLDGIPVSAMEKGNKKFANTPSAPPPTEASQGTSETESIEEEKILPLTQPPPKDDVCPNLIPLDHPSSPEE